MGHATFTLAAACTHEVTIRKSRFLAHCAPASDPAAALDYVREVGKAGGNHACWAYRMGQQYRFHDDGEPSGSAGKPILAAIEGQDLDGVVAVVTRWFGGIKLGIGGLIRAYGGTAAECMRRGARVPVVARTRLILACSYADLPLIKARMAALDVQVAEERYGASRVRMELDVPDANVDALRQLLADVSHGNGTLRAAH